MLRTLVALLLASTACAGFCQERSTFGHSHLGSAFDSGLRTKPWKFEGLGQAPFPVSTTSSELQSWYDQGNALLHSFWFEEAERTFRWCLKLDRENAMVYFGLARCGLNWFTIQTRGTPELTRFQDFLKEAVKRKERVTLRERLYIEAWDAAWSKPGDQGRKEMISRLQKLCLLFPDDIEAKCQLAFYNIGEGSAFANQLLIQDVLKVNPMHPGAHHAQIHNWDDVDGGQAIASCELYGRAAPGVGHALHMPGHIYAGIGMWHEAAIAMDSATRVELRHMNERLALPFENWNYPHNRDYLCYIQEQLGRAEDSIRGIKDIMNSPKDPAVLASQYPAVLCLVRALLKFERWDDILNDATWAGQEGPEFDEMIKAAKVIALAGKGKIPEARAAWNTSKEGGQKMMDAIIAQNPDQADAIRKDFEQNMPAVFRVAEAHLLLAEGKRQEGLNLLLAAAEKEKATRERREYSNDPPFEAWPLMRLVGDAHLAGGDAQAAIQAYESSLESVRNDAWSLAGLAKAHAALGETEKAVRFAGRFMAVWSGADPHRLTKEVSALNLGAKPQGETLRPERQYLPSMLNHLGPSNWEPFAAPELDCLDMNGRRVKLSRYKGKNVLLVFYLSDQCVHCMEQLKAINDKLKDFAGLDCAVLAVSAALPAANKASVNLSPFKVSLLSDPSHLNARRFSSYDDFEDMELHSTILIDRKGRVRWKRTGGEPFADVDFLLKEMRRWHKLN